MIAALTLFIVLTLSVLVIRTGAVALRLTGLTDASARFQARSAFTGTGFTGTGFAWTGFAGTDFFARTRSRYQGMTLAPTIAHWMPISESISADTSAV